MALSVEERVFNIVKQPIEELGLKIYDIEYVKEGAERYLRIYIDKDPSVTIEDCEKVSRLIDPILDEEDPIKEGYCLEVSSPGIERNLRKQEHFDKAQGKEIEISLFKPDNGMKKIVGILQKANEGEIEILFEDEKKVFNRKDVSKVKTVYKF